MNWIERMIFTSPGGKYREFEGLETHFEPKDVALYRDLLPKTFAMPLRPIVTIFVADYIRLIPWPMTRYQEWSVLLKSVWNEEEGWYSVTMPVTKWLAMSGGRYLGFPKYITDEIILARSGETYTANARYKGLPQLTLDFHPGLTRQLAPWEQALMDNESFFKGNGHQLVPPGKGPQVQRIVIQHILPPKWSPECGMVRVRIHSNETWKSLVPDQGEFPGTVNHFSGGFNLVPERMN